MKSILDDYLDDGWPLDLEGRDLGLVVGRNLDGDLSLQLRRGGAGIADHSFLSVAELRQRYCYKYGMIMYVSNAL